MKTWSVMRLAMFVLTGWAPIASANLITNGTFEIFTGTFGADGGALIAPGNTSVTGWSVSGSGNIAIVQNGNIWKLIAADGKNLLDMTGYHDSTIGLSTISQNVSGLTIGVSYGLSFLLGLIKESSGTFDGPNGVSVTLVSSNSSSTRQFNMDVNIPQPGRLTNTIQGREYIWDPFSFAFTADATSVQVGFVGTIAHGHNVYLGLDSISLVQAAPVPEPQTWLVLAAGLTGLGVAMRRRKARSCFPL